MSFNAPASAAPPRPHISVTHRHVLHSKGRRIKQHSTSMNIQTLCVPHCVTAGSIFTSSSRCTSNRPADQSIKRKHHSVQPIRIHIGWTLSFYRPAALRFYDDRLDIHCVRCPERLDVHTPNVQPYAFHTRHRLDDSIVYRPADAVCGTHIGWTMSKTQ
jgi:hypothetical protein